MKPSATPLIFVLLGVILFAGGLPDAGAQGFYLIRKAQVFIQTGGTATPGGGFSAPSITAPSGTFVFSAQAPAAATLAVPGGRAIPLLARPGGGDFQFAESFTTAAAMDSTYPNGTYQWSGAGIPTLNLALQPDSYPASPPAVVQTTWNNSLLVLDPSRANTLTLSSNSGFATAGAGARMSIELSGLQDNVSLRNEIFSKAVFGFPAANVGFTSFSIPAGSLTTGHVYQGEIIWDVATTLDENSIRNGGALAVFARVLRFYVVARAGDATMPPPVLVNSPADTLAALGGSVSLRPSVTIGGAAPGPGRFPAVVWFLNGQRLQIDGAKYSLNNGVELVISNLTLADQGRYYAHIMNSGGLITTRAATLTVLDRAPAVFVRQPAPLTVGQGSTAVFSVEVSAPNTPLLTYHWRLNGRDLPPTFPGVNGPTLVIPNASASDLGSYSVDLRINGVVGTSTSSTPAFLSVVGRDATRLANLSILTSLAAGETMTLGTVLGGPGTSGSKALLARAGGPSLAQLGVSDALPDPAMAINDTSVVPAVQVAANDDWNGASELISAFASVGAFPYSSATSKDAAIFRPNLSPGNYTIDVRPVAGSGMVIAELYDATPSGQFTASTPRLMNVSVLKSIATGGSLTAGFVITGATARTVLIRAVGPGLAGVGVSGFMSDPQLTLASTNDTPAVLMGANNDWNGDAAIAQTAARVGAFVLPDPASKDAVLLTTLMPGNYTVQVRPVGVSAGGRVLVEIYEVP